MTVLATAKHLRPDGFGQFGTLVNYTALVTVLIDLGFNTLYVREGARHPGELGRYLSNLLSARLLLAPLALGVLALALIRPGLESLLIPGFVLMLLASYSGLLRGTFYAQQKVTYEAISIVIESVVLLSLTLVGILGNRGVAWFLWSYAASYAVACGFIAWVLISRRMVRITWQFEFDLVRRFFWQGLPFAMTFLITTIYFKIDVPILQFFRSYTEVGWYTLAYKPFEALLFIPITMLNVIFPVLSIYHRENQQRLKIGIDRFYKALLLIGWPVSVGTFMLAPGLTRLLLPYPEAEPALAILSVGIVAMFVNNAFIGALNSIDRQVAFTWAAAASMVVNVALNLALIPRFGYLGSSVATVITEFFLIAAGWYLTARYLHRVPLLGLSWKILLSGAVMGVALIPFRHSDGVSVGVAIVAGGVVYAVMTILLRIIRPEEIEMVRDAVGRRPR